MPEEKCVFDIKLEEYANEITYDEFKQLATVRIQDKGTKVLDMWEKDDVRFVVSYESLFPGDTLLSVISPDDSWDEERAEEEYPGYVHYLSWNFVDSRISMFYFLYWELDLFNTPPSLWEKKKLIDRELMPLDYSTINERISINRPSKCRKDYMSAEKIINDFDLCKSSSDIEWYYFKNRYSFCDPLVIMGVDLYRGQEREQKIIAEMVKIECLSESKVVFQLWDTDAGFEILKKELSEYERNGQVLYERARYDENFSGENENG